MYLIQIYFLSSCISFLYNILYVTILSSFCGNRTNKFWFIYGIWRSITVWVCQLYRIIILMLYTRMGWYPRWFWRDERIAFFEHSRIRRLFASSYKWEDRMFDTLYTERKWPRLALKDLDLRWKYLNLSVCRLVCAFEIGCNELTPCLDPLHLLLANASVKPSHQCLLVSSRDRNVTT